MVGLLSPSQFGTLRNSLTVDRYEPTPAETLLNLGFVAGEGMAADFLDLCENPDPIESAPLFMNGHGDDDDEDEETVWRRLVMRGRFV